MSKRTDFHNLTLVTESDLRNTEDYRSQVIKERFYSSGVACDTTGANSVFSGLGVVREPADLRFVGTEGSPITNPQFTIGSGVAYTRFNPDLTQNPQYVGGERISIYPNALPVTIANTTPAKYYVYLVYVELQKSQTFDESGANAYFVDREDSFIVVQMTQAQATALNSFNSNPNGSVVISNIVAPWMYALFNNDVERTATFPGWTPSGGFTIQNYTVTHYNSVFLGEIQVTNATGPVWHFYHTLPGGDPLSVIMFRSGFSIADQFHRTEIGRGIVSTTNPHGMILQDLGNLDDTRELTSSGIVSPSKFDLSLECMVDGNTGHVVITQLAAGDYLFLGGKRITNINNLFIAVSGLAHDQVNYVYVQVSGSIQTLPAAPWNYYNGIVSAGTAVPADAFVLCSVYYDFSGTTHALAYEGDPRYNAGLTNNPVTDLRVFGVYGYDYIHNTIFEASGKENLVPNGDMQIAEGGKIAGWVTGAQAVLTSAGTPSSGSTALQIGASLNDSSLMFPFDANSNYSFRAKLHTQGLAQNFDIKIQLFRGKDRALDHVGDFTLQSSITPTYSSWTMIESEFLSNSTITYISPSTDGNMRNNIGWAAILIENGSANPLFVDDVVLRPKIRTIDLDSSSVTTTKIAPLAVTNSLLGNSAVNQSKIQTGVYSVIKGHLDATGDLTHIDALVDGNNADALHSHSVGSTNILTAAAASFTVNIALTPGTWFVQAWCASHDSLFGPNNLVIDGVTVLSWNLPMSGFGARAGVAGNRTITVNVTATGGENHILVVATRTS